MAGRGFTKEVPPIFNEGIHALRNGRWQVMSEPLHNDRPTAGIGLAASFAAAWRLQQPAAEIGLIPCADGGTNLDEWAAGGVLYDNAVAQAKLAQRSSRLSGILWHQGESDCFPDRATLYAEKFAALITQLRAELDVPDIPLIVGGLGDFLTTGLYGQYFTSYKLINDALLAFAHAQPDCYYVTATGLTANGDQIHFNAASQRILGVRYFEAFSKRQNILIPLLHEAEILQTIYNRPVTQKEKKILLEYRFSAGELTQEEFIAQSAALQ